VLYTTVHQLPHDKIALKITSGSNLKVFYSLAVGDPVLNLSGLSSRVTKAQGVMWSFCLCELYIKDLCFSITVMYTESKEVSIHDVFG
jgi:hypothetical protein